MPGKDCSYASRVWSLIRIDYLVGHFNRPNVEAFVANNASSWGTEHLFVRMSWGYPKYLVANVVALTLRSSSSEMGFQDQAIANGTSRPLLVRKQSPPLGIPLAAMEEMENVYSRYIQEIVEGDLRAYISMAYKDQISMFPERLLGVVCSFYRNCFEADSEVISDPSSW